MNKIFLGNFQTHWYEGVLTASATTFADGDVVCSTYELALVSALHPDSSVLRGRIVAFRLLDEDARSFQRDVFFMKTNVSLGTVDSAVSISDADAREIIGHGSVSSFTSLVNSQQGDAYFVAPIPFELATKYLYIGMVARSTPAGASTAAGMRFKLGVELHNHVIAY